MFDYKKLDQLLHQKGIRFHVVPGKRIRYTGHLNDLEENIKIYYFEHPFCRCVLEERNTQTETIWLQKIKEKMTETIQAEERDLSLYLHATCEHRLEDMADGRKLLRLVKGGDTLLLVLSYNQKERKWYPNRYNELLKTMSDKPALLEAFKETSQWKLFQAYVPYYRVVLLF